MIVKEYDSDPTVGGHRSAEEASAADDGASFAQSEAPLRCREYVVGTTITALERTKVPSSLEVLHRYFVRGPKQVFRDLFLPIGYPHSVAKGYVQYQFYDSLQGLCSYLRGVVSTSAVLTAAGVGDAEATAISAAVTWATKDGLGMIGGLVFSYVASSHFDSYVKEYRLFADVINDVGLTLDMVAPLVHPSRVLYVWACATICKVMCGMAAGATKGSITQHFAICGNMADLNAKESTQETLVSLTGMILGIALARYLSHLEEWEKSLLPSGSSLPTWSMAAMVSWSIFIVLTLVHVWANYLGVALLRLRTLNRERAEVLLKDVVTSCVSQTVLQLNDARKQDETPLSTHPLPSPDHVCESLVMSTLRHLFPGKICLSKPIGQILQAASGQANNDITHCFNEFAAEKYLVFILVPTPLVNGIESARTPASVRALRIKQFRSAMICTALKVGATGKDELRAFLNALVIRESLARCLQLLREYQAPGILLQQSNRWTQELIGRSHRCVQMVCGDVQEEDQVGVSTEYLETIGWDVKTRLYIGFGRWRLETEEDDDRKMDGGSMDEQQDEAFGETGHATGIRRRTGGARGGGPKTL